MPTTIDRAALERFKNFKLSEADGAKALDDTERKKSVDNNVATVSFFADSPRGATPFLRAKPSLATDPAKLERVITATPEQIAELPSDPAKFAALLKKTIEERNAYLRPQFGSIEGVPTRFKFNAIVGQRIKQFLAEGEAIAQQAYGRNAAALEKASYALNTAGFDLFARELVFDEFEMSGYGSFGHDSGFIHAWETRLAEIEKMNLDILSPDQRATVEREKQQIQGELDTVFRSKYVYNNSSMYEVDAEKSVGLCLIDKKTRQRLSEVEDTRSGIVPAFEILNLAVNGQDRAVYFDVDEKKYYFDRSDEVVARDLEPQIRRHRLTDAEAGEVTFRRAASGEHLRKNFRFDWDGDGYVQKTSVDWVSWAGHCNDKANLEGNGVILPNAHEGVYEYNSASGSTAHYNRDLLNEQLMSFSEFGSYLCDPRTGNVVKNLDNTRWAGARDDDEPDRLVFGQTQVPYQRRPNKFTIEKVESNEQAYDGNEVFRQYLVASDEKSAKPNPMYSTTTDGDIVNLKLGNAVVHARAEYQVFDDQSGYPSMVSKNITLDFAHPGTEPVVVDSIMKDPSKREMYEISLDLANKKWIAQPVRMEKKPDGNGYEKKKIGEATTRNIDPNTMVGQRETSLDDPASYMPFVKEALQTGRNFTSETADGAGVWNGRTKRLAQSVDWRDDATKWAKVSIDVDARYGGNSGSFLVKLKDDGKPDFYVPLALPFDFAWGNDVAWAAETEGLINAKAYERDVVTLSGRTVQADACANMLDVLHCAFNKRPYVIWHEGQRYFFDDKAKWEAAKTKLDTMRKAITEGAIPGPGPEPTPTPVVGTILEVADGRVGKNGLIQHQLVAEGDGKITVTLRTQSGDADLYTNRGGPATNKDGEHTQKSWNSDTNADELVIENVKRGETIGIAIHGYKESAYKLTVVGPKTGGTPPEPVTPPMDISVHGVATRGEEKHVDVLEIAKDATLDVKLSGSGDADVYVRKGAKPTTGAYDLRLYDDGSNEHGTLPVKKGDKIYVMVRGYAPTSEYDLTVKTA